MLTKSEYSTSTSSLSSVFSSSLMELNSNLQKPHKVSSIGKAHQKPGYFRNRLRERINKNKLHIADLNKTIKQSAKDILEINQLKKAFYQNEVAPLMTFVNQVKNTTDAALLSMQRELAKKDSELEYVVYDRHVIWLDHKFAKDETSSVNSLKHKASLFKNNVVEKENAKYLREVKNSEMLLKEGEGLMQSCKQKIDQKNQKLKQLVTTIKGKEDTLTSKMTELHKIQDILACESSYSNTRNSQSSNKASIKKMNSFILNAKMVNIKKDILRFTNEKLDLESTHMEYARDLDNLKLAIQEMEKRNTKELRQVKNIEDTVDWISAKNRSEEEQTLSQMHMSSQKLISRRSKLTMSASTGISTSTKAIDEFDRHSVVTNIESELESYIKNEKTKKESLLKQINGSKKRKTENSRYNRYLDTKTMKPVDWNHIDEQDESVYSEAKHTWAEEKSIEECKLQNSVEEDKPESLSFTDISFRSVFDFTDIDILFVH